MPGRADRIHEGRCHDHAHFMKNLSVEAANVVFWALFILNVKMGVITSLCLMQAQKEYE